MRESTAQFEKIGPFVFLTSEQAFEEEHQEANASIAEDPDGRKTLNIVLKSKDHAENVNEARRILEWLVGLSDLEKREAESKLRDEQAIRDRVKEEMRTW